MAGSIRARVIAMTCSARLSWRSPPRCRRWRARWPEEHWIGAIPAWRAKLASERKRFAPAVLLISVAAVRVPQPVSARSCGAVSFDERQQLPLERVGLAPQAAQLHNLLARDPDPSARFRSPQPAVDPIELAWPGDRARRQ